MRTPGNGIVPDSVARSIQQQTSAFVADYVKSHQTDAAKLTKYKRDLSVGRTFDENYLKEDADRMGITKAVLRQVVHAVNTGKASLAKAGVTSSLGYNFYDLRSPAFLLYPVNTPFRNSMARVGKQNAGVGTVANWKATRNPGTPYVGVPEGQRAQVGTPDENNYFATYKELGDERSVTYTAEFAGEGYTDNLADEHLRGLQALWLQEESLILFGNSGTGSGNNGFALGTCPTPTVVLNTGTTSTLGSGVSVSVACVLLTQLGYPSTGQYGYLGGTRPTVASGLTPSFSYSAPGTSQSITISGGTSAVSAMSAIALTTAANTESVTATIAAPPNGAFAYAWYVNVTDASAPAKANAHLYAITTIPSVTITSAPGATQNAAATGLNVDNSFEPYDFDGLLTYAAVNGIWQNLAGASLTSQIGGVVPEVENILEQLFQLYQLGVDCIWGDALAVKALSQAILANGSGPAGYTVFMNPQAPNGVGGFIVTGYQSRYAVANPTGAGVIPIKIHPMMPPGTLYFDVATNPYPTSRIPFVRELYVQRDYYSIEWPPVSRAWAFGTYVHEVLAHYMPWATAVLTGIGPFVAS